MKLLLQLVLRLYTIGRYILPPEFLLMLQSRLRRMLWRLRLKYLQLDFLIRLQLFEMIKQHRRVTLGPY